MSPTGNQNMSMHRASGPISANISVGGANFGMADHNVSVNISNSIERNSVDAPEVYSHACFNVIQSRNQVTQMGMQMNYIEVRFTAAFTFALP